MPPATSTVEQESWLSERAQRLLCFLTVMTLLLLTRSPACASTLTFTYDAAGRLVGVNSGANTNTTFSYDNNGNVLGSDTFVSGNPDLTVAQSAAPDPVAVGTLLFYSVSIFNNSTADASSVTLTNTLPLNAAFVSSSATEGSVTRTGNVLTWNIGALAGAASATLDFAIRPDVVGTLTNALIVNSAQADPSPGDNSSALSTQVVPPPTALAGLEGGSMALFWPILGGDSFTVEYSDSLSPADWRPLDAPIAAEGYWLYVEDPQTNSQRFYRLAAP